MATPIRYTPQVIPTDLGNALLAEQQRRQGQYDVAFSGMNTAEDQFGQFQVDPTDIEGKNAILGEFRNRTKQIIDKYGGDYGAAAKELAREVTKTRSNQFFQLAPYKQRLAEEERQRLQQLGTNAIVLKSISQTPIVDPITGKLASKEDLQSNILDRRQLEQAFATQFGELAKQTREEDIKSKHPGYFATRIHKGIKESEVPEIAQKGTAYLKSLNPEIPDDIAYSISHNMARELVGGYQDQEQADRTWMSPEQSLDYKIKKMQYNALMNPASTELPYTTTKSYYDTTKDSSTVKGLHKKFFDARGVPMASYFGKQGQTNPMKQYENAQKVYGQYKEKLKQLQSPLNAKPEIRQKLQIEVNRLKALSDATPTYINEKEYNTLKQVGLSSSDNYKDVREKLFSYEDKMSKRYSGYDIPGADPEFIGKKLYANAGNARILYPVDENMTISGKGISSVDARKVIGSVNEKTGEFKSLVGNPQFVPGIKIPGSKHNGAFIITGADNKIYAVAAGAINDQMDDVISKNQSYINNLIDSGAGESAKQLSSVVAANLSNFLVQPKQTEVKTWGK